MEKLLKKHELCTKGTFMLRTKNVYENFELRKS